MGYIFTPKMSNTEKQYLQYIEHSRWGVLASSPPFKRGGEGIICTGPSELYKKHFNMLACDYSPWTTLNLQMNRTNLQLGLAPKNLTKACVALQVIQQSTPNDCEDKIEWYLPEHVQKIVMYSCLLLLNLTLCLSHSAQVRIRVASFHWRSRHKWNKTSPPEHWAHEPIIKLAP